MITAMLRFGNVAALACDDRFRAPTVARFSLLFFWQASTKEWISGKGAQPKGSDVSGTPGWWALVTSDPAGWMQFGMSSREVELAHSNIGSFVLDNRAQWEGR